LFVVVVVVVVVVAAVVIVDCFCAIAQLQNHSLACPYEKRIESTIQIMAETLLGHLKKSTINYYYSGKEFAEIQQIQQVSVSVIYILKLTNRHL
jgi:hypothetical protein